LPPFAEMKKEVLNYLLMPNSNELSPYQQNILRSELGHPLVDDSMDRLCPECVAKLVFKEEIKVQKNQLANPHQETKCKWILLFRN